MLGRLTVATRLEQPREQLLGRLAGLELEQLVVVGVEQQARLELEQRRDQDEELRRRLEVELAARLEVVEVGEHDVGQLDLGQLDLLAQDERQQQVERAGENLEVELERGDVHGDEGSGAGRRQRVRRAV